MDKKYLNCPRPTQTSRRDRSFSLHQRIFGLTQIRSGNPSTVLHGMAQKFFQPQPTRTTTCGTNHHHINIIQMIRKQFGKEDLPLALNVGTNGIADSGCQTCTAGPAILTKLRCPNQYLVKTKHKIICKTDTPLHIMGTLFLCISYGNKSSNQMVYISKNC